MSYGGNIPIASVSDILIFRQKGHVYMYVCYVTSTAELFSFRSRLHVPLYFGIVVALLAAFVTTSNFCCIHVGSRSNNVALGFSHCSYVTKLLVGFSIVSLFLFRHRSFVFIIGYRIALEFPY